MDEPKLYAENNKLSHIGSNFCLEKYKNFLKWNQNETIMEFGIGDGGTSKSSLYPLLPADMKEYVACDISQKFLDYLKGNALHSKMTYLLMDVATRDLPRDLEKQYDHVFSLFCLHWIQDTKQAFRNVFKMLKPGGQIFFVAFGETPIDDSLNLLSKNPRWAKYGHEKFLSPYYADPDVLKKYENALIEAGFTDRLCVLEKQNYKFSSNEEYKNLFFAVNPILNQIPQEDLENYKQDYIEATFAGKINTLNQCEQTGQRLPRSDYNLVVLIASKPNDKQNNK